MIHCPNCGNPLQADPGAEARMACPSCGYVLDAAQGGAASGPGLPADAEPRGCSQPVPGVDSPAPVQGEAYWGTRGSAPAAGQAPMPSDGAPWNGTPPQGAPGANLPKGMAVAALVLGIAAILLCWVPVANIVAFVLGAIAIVLGFMARSRAARGIAAGGGMGLAGGVLGIVAVVLSIVISLCFVAAVRILGDGGFFYSSSPGVSSVEEGSDSASGAAAGGAPADGPWTSMEFDFADEDFQLGDTDLEDFEEDTGWVLDLRMAGYPDGYIVQAGEEITAIDLANAAYPDDYVYVSVKNNGRDQCDLKECELSRISVESPSGNLACMAAGGVGLGSTVDEVIAVYGTPVHDYASGNGAYRSLTYISTDYRKQIEFTASEGTVVDGFAMALL